MDRRSLNFSAEVLGKALAFDGGSAGTIANAAAAICAFEAAHHVTGRCHDASGLSYANRQTAAGMVRLLWFADHQPWAGTLRTSLPDGGQGTLKDRLAHVRVRAKTGTLDNVSALTGLGLERCRRHLDRVLVAHERDGRVQGQDDRGSGGAPARRARERPDPLEIDDVAHDRVLRLAR